MEMLWPLDGNGMEGGSVTISEEVQLELPLESKIAPRGEECTYGKKTFQITAYDNQLQNETYQADIALYRENDTERTTPVYQTKHSDDRLRIQGNDTGYNPVDRLFRKYADGCSAGAFRWRDS